MTVCIGVSCLLQTYCLVADVTDLAHSCDDRMSHGRRSHALVSGQSLAYHFSGIQREIGPRALVLPVAVVGSGDLVTVNTVVLNCCKGDRPSQWETPIFGPL